MLTKTRATADPQPPADPRIKEGDGRAGVPAPSADPGPIALAAAKQILIIDDDHDVRALVAKTVARAGFRADIVSDGEHGWLAFCRNAYDLVITSHEMPGQDGLKLIERIRAFSKEPPCILIAGDLPSAESFLKPLVGHGAILEKPFSPSALIEKIYGLLLHGNVTES
jgi:DNA-binding response OmpR family regulator